MQARQYAQALTEFIQAHPRTEAATIATRLTALLKRRGHTGLLPRIIAEYEKETARLEKKTRVHLTVAHEKERAAALQKGALVASEFGIAHTKIDVGVDPGLLGGYTLKGPGFRFDASYRSRLLALYKKLTTHN